MSTPTVEEVRAEVEALIANHWSNDITCGEWWAAMQAAGLSSPMLPVNAGGRDWPRDLANAVSAALKDANVLGPPAGLGRMLAAPTIATHGTQDQIDEFVTPILAGEVGWCQLFSEPNAGSDLAGLQCKAIRDGDEWIITGQKVWTSGGQSADWGMLLARTDIDAPKHKGISWFAMKMDQPGVDIRPLREMTGRALFNEVFIEEARVSNDHLIGGLNNGWAVGNTTLMFERASLGSAGKSPSTAVPGPLGKAMDRKASEFVSTRTSDGGVPGLGPDLWRYYVELATKNGRNNDPVLRDALIKLWTLIEINRFSIIRGKAGSRTGAEGNIAKLTMSEMFRQFRDVGAMVIGADAMLWGDSDSQTGGAIGEIATFSPGPAIYGGTDQIQRNIIGERVLGLPKEPGPAKETPFRELPKN